MNTLGFLVCNLGKKLGIRRNGMWRLNINREHHILKVTEQTLGEQAWTEVEHVEELTIEYWEIKDIENQQLELEKRNRKLEKDIDQSRIQREEITRRINETLENSKGELIDKTSALDVITNEVDQLEHEKRLVEKRFEAIKLKRKVLLEQGEDTDKAQTIYENLKELKEQHIAKKEALAARKQAYEEADATVADINSEISRLQDSISEETANVTEEFNQLSRRVAQNRSRIGALELTKNRAHIRIGRYLGLHRDDATAEVRAICRNHRTLIAKVVALRRSMNYHRLLAGGK